jgi:hypothetical protein
VKRTIEVLNELEKKGVFSRYAIGGAMGAIFYTEPFLTFDLDVFVVLPSTGGGLLTLAPIYDSLRARGFVEENQCVIIEGCRSELRSRSQVSVWSEYWLV